MIHVLCWDAGREKQSEGSDMWVKSMRDAAVEYAKMAAEANDGPPIRVVVAACDMDVPGARVYKYWVQVVVEYRIVKEE